MNLELINDFVDGTLPIEKEEELFALLSTDACARTELKHQLSMKDAIKSDSKAFTPSVKSTAAIFSSLGFTPPVAAQIPEPMPATKSLINKFVEFANANISSIIASIASAGLTATFFLAFIASNSDTIADLDAQSLIYPQNKTYSILYDYPLTNNSKSVIDDLANATQTISHIPIISTKNIDNKDLIKISPNLPDNSTNNSQEHIIEFSNSINKDDVGFGRINYENRSSALYESLDAMNHQFELVNTSNNNEFSFELYGSHYITPQENINISNEQTLNNIILNLIYSINEEFSIGLDYRRENFYLIFEGNEKREKSNALYRYEMKPNFETAGLLLRYNPKFAKLPYTQLFAQSVVGGNKVGYVGRAMIGAELVPIPNYSIIIGYDWSNMFYSFQDKWFSTTKKGIHFGVGVKL